MVQGMAGPLYPSIAVKKPLAAAAAGGCAPHQRMRVIAAFGEAGDEEASTAAPYRDHTGG